MVGLPSVDRVDLGTLALVVGLLFAAYVVYPTRITKVAAWYAVIMIFTCWTGYFVYRLAFDEAEFWE